MLNQRDERNVEVLNQWCVGEPPLRWDVSFGARLAEKIKQMLWRDRGERAVPSREAGEGTLPVMRKAA